MDDMLFMRSCELLIACPCDWLLTDLEPRTKLMERQTSGLRLQNQSEGRVPKSETTTVTPDLQRQR